MAILNAEFLNKSCQCKTLDQQGILQTGILPPNHTGPVSISETEKYFSDRPHFLARQDFLAMSQFIEDYNDLIAAPAVSEKLAGVAGSDIKELGVFNSFDFHITDAGPKLIEINTNAAGGILAKLALENTKKCCRAMIDLLAEQKLPELTVAAMFQSEFQRRFPQQNLRTIAIVDEAPQLQFFYPEFLLLQKQLQGQGLTVVIGSPEELSYDENGVYLKETTIDFIYNRSTDFYFSKPESQSLKEIFTAGLVTVSPNPVIHALFAQKNNLAKLWSDSFFNDFHDNVFVQQKIHRLREVIPQTVFVSEKNAAELWQQRKNWFFKPIHGYAGKGAYRGEKLTQKVWHEIIHGKAAYIAQEYVPPKIRQVEKEIWLKYDLRVYTYGRNVFGLVARYYEGQTTNMRTRFGGLASVFLVE